MESSAYRERIYGIFSQPSTGVEEKVARGLDVGTEFLGLPIGFLTRIEQGTQEVIQATGGHPLIQPGETCPLENAYCRRTVEIDSALAVQNAAVSDAVSESAFETFELGAYIGAKVVVDQETYGTVCFADDEHHEEEFTDAEANFVELLARLVSQALERRAYERELEAREAKLDEQQEIYRAVIDASFDLVFRIDDSGEFTYLSSPVTDLLGHDPETYVGQPFTTMLPDDETVDLATELFEKVMAGETVEEHYFPLEHRTGEQVFVDIRVTPLYEGDVPPAERTPADIVGAQGMARDATDRYRRDRLIRVLNRVLRHNLRNDMTVIGGCAEALQERCSGSDADLAERILDTSDGLVQLTETARKLEQNLDEPSALEPTDVVALVTASVRKIREEYPDATVSVDAPDVATARIAPRLETAMTELLDNAARHAGESPSIDVDVSVRDERVVVRVADDGPGLPENERAVLVSGEETPLVHGSGLGLWLVHWIVGSCDGSLRVDDDANGAVIEILLRQSGA